MSFLQADSLEHNAIPESPELLKTEAAKSRLSRFSKILAASITLAILVIVAVVVTVKEVKHGSPESTYRGIVNSSFADGQCGVLNGGNGVPCFSGYCCSSFGWCGNDDNYCGAGCQSGYGSCSGSQSGSISSNNNDYNNGGDSVSNRQVSGSGQIRAIVNAGGDLSQTSGNAHIDCPSLKIDPDGLYAGAPPFTVNGVNIPYCGSQSTLYYQEKQVTVTISWYAGGNDRNQAYFELNDRALAQLTNNFPGQFEATCSGTCPFAI
ncbi:hypothetical protein BC830DRAFT_1080657 [Chytriomyces sp. MP71]|nr:hypothetical protein BC830DRAFT_1080657 [Chytriomyces sp. MP71]